MILDESKAQERLDSPANLMNRLKELTEKKSANPCLPPSSDEVIENLEEKLVVGGLKSKAAKILNTALDEINSRIHELKPGNLAYIANTMNGIVNSDVAKKESVDNSKPQIIIYAPQQYNESHYETITVQE